MHVIRCNLLESEMDKCPSFQTCPICDPNMPSLGTINNHQDPRFVSKIEKKNILQKSWICPSSIRSNNRLQNADVKVSSRINQTGVKVEQVMSLSYKSFNPLLISAFPSMSKWQQVESAHPSLMPPVCPSNFSLSEFSFDVN